MGLSVLSAKAPSLLRLCSASSETEIGRRDQRGRTVAQKKHGEKSCRPESRVFPPAVGIAEQPSLLAVNGDDGSENERYQQQGDITRIDAENETRRAQPNSAAMVT